jgi:uncharacterized membrane protein YeaQ/YmgE (transglycosylase-associated protein family)
MVPTEAIRPPGEVVCKTSRVNVMGILILNWSAWVVVGAIAGYVATIVLRYRSGVGLTVSLGIVGALLGGWVASSVFDYGNVTGFNPYSIVVAIAGAFVVVASWHGWAVLNEDHLHI